MPRPAAIILGLAFVSLSIGFNMTRYPMVWEMVGPSRASGSTQPADAVEPKPAEVQPAVEQAGPGPERPIEIEPMPEVGNQQATAELDSRSPLVPVVPIGPIGATGDTTLAAEGVRRLPPVGANAATPGGGLFGDGTIPIYPTTGIE